MSIFKRGNVYWYHFIFDGKHVQKSTRLVNHRAARQMEAAHRTALAKGEAGFRERKAVTLAAFLKDEFLPFVESKFGATTPKTLSYYQYGARSLCELDFASLDISALTDQHAGQYAAKKQHWSPSTVNRGLRTLRRALSLAYQWGKIDRKPKITLAKGERQRERVLAADEVTEYLAACAQPWRDVATVMLGTGLRPSEVFAMRWESVLLTDIGGVLQVTEGKSRAARRMLPLVPAVHRALSACYEAQARPSEGWLFPAGTKSGHLENGSAKNCHRRAIKALAPLGVKGFQPYCLRHTALTNLAASGCDAFTLARIAGHSSITITQRYCHPQADSIERAFHQLTAGSESPTLASGAL